MSTIVIEEISPELYAKLEQEANHYRRSITQQIIALLERAMTPHPSQPTSFAEKQDSEWVYVNELNIINQRAEQLNEEALDVLTY
ncbi:MAG: hypothetical protein ABFS56_35740, partial [Pseudomonadota bacterium]